MDNTNPFYSFINGFTIYIYVESCLITEKIVL